MCAAKGQKRDLENQIRGLLKNLGLVIGTFYAFPAEHWKHLRTTNPIESTFATECARRDAAPTRRRSPWRSSWSRPRGKAGGLDSHNQLPKIIQGVKFADGLEVIAKADRPSARNHPPPDPSGRHQDLAIANMDIILQTNTDNPFLALRAVERFQDGSGYSSQIAVRSDWIAVNYKFYFEEQALKTFIVGLEQLDRTLAGQARLKPMWEEQFLEFDGVGSGRVKVSGDLIEHSEWQQRVQFAFGTDQTCVRLSSP